MEVVERYSVMIPQAFLDPAFGVSCDFSRVLWWIQCLECDEGDILRRRRRCVVAAEVFLGLLRCA